MPELQFILAADVIPSTSQQRGSNNHSGSDAGQRSPEENLWLVVLWGIYKDRKQAQAMQKRKKVARISTLAPVIPACAESEIDPLLFTVDDIRHLEAVATGLGFRGREFVGKLLGLEGDGAGEGRTKKEIAQ